MAISKVGVLGAGLMGHGITQICAQAGWDVVVREVDDERLAGGLGKIEKQLGRAVEKGKLEQSDADEIRGRIQREHCGRIEFDPCLEKVQIRAGEDHAGVDPLSTLDTRHDAQLQHELPAEGESGADEDVDQLVRGHACTMPPAARGTG